MNQRVQREAAHAFCRWVAKPARNESVAEFVYGDGHQKANRDAENSDNA